MTALPHPELEERGPGLILPPGARPREDVRVRYRRRRSRGHWLVERATQDEPHVVVPATSGAIAKLLVDVLNREHVDWCKLTVEFVQAETKRLQEEAKRFRHEKPCPRCRGKELTGNSPPTCLGCGALRGDS